MSKYQLLDEYINKSISEGKTINQLKIEMEQSGYSHEDIKAIFPDTDFVSKKPIRKKIYFILPFVLFLIILLSGFFYLNTSGWLNNLDKKGFVVDDEVLNLNQIDISNLTNPAIVKIYHSFKGVLKVPKFEIDLETLEFEDLDSAEMIEVEFDDYGYGTGFIATSDGYIVTNSHVVSKNSIAYSMAAAGVQVWMEQTSSSYEKMEKIQETLDSMGVSEQDSYDFGVEWAEKLITELTSKIEWVGDNSIIVADQSFKTEKISDIIKNGFEAEIVNVNDLFYLNDKDIALIKINQEKLPTIDLEYDLSNKRGDDVFIHGFPSTGDLNTASSLSPTFSSGIISSLKTSKTGEFDIIQTDAKGSTGSSGSPLLNNFGRAIGIITLASVAGESGDTFIFALPSSLIVDTLSSEEISIKKSDYVNLFRDILYLYSENRCEEVIEKINQINSLNQNFNIDDNTEDYYESCKNVIDSGDSINSKLDKIKKWFINSDNHIVIAFGLIIIILIIIIIFISIKIRNNARDIDGLESR